MKKSFVLLLLVVGSIVFSCSSAEKLYSSLTESEKTTEFKSQTQFFLNKDTLCMVGAITSSYIEGSLSIVPSSALKKVCEEAKKHCTDNSVPSVFDVRACKGEVTVVEWQTCMTDLKAFLAEWPSSTNPYQCEEDFSKSEKVMEMLKKTPTSCVDFAKKCQKL